MKVKIVQNKILVGNIEVAAIEGTRGDYWLVSLEPMIPTLYNRFIARFKYGKKSEIIHFAKFIFTNVTSEQAVRNSASESPMIWAKKIGYVRGGK